MKKIYMIGMGGSVEHATIEVHDMQFVISETKEEAFDIVKDRWYGTSLHIDSYIEMNYIDGYEIDLSGTSNKSLYMIVYGGYKAGFIDELHNYNFVLAESIEEAKTFGKSLMSSYEYMDHIDNVVNVFEYLNTRFGFNKGDYSFSMNKINHTFIKLIK